MMRAFRHQRTGKEMLFRKMQKFTTLSEPSASALKNLDNPLPLYILLVQLKGKLCFLLFGELIVIFVWLSKLSLKLREGLFTASQLKTNIDIIIGKAFL